MTPPRNKISNLLQFFDNKSVMVTGGTGFIGSNLVNKLLDSKVKKIIVLDNLSFGKKSNVKKDPRVQFVNFNLGRDNPVKLDLFMKDTDFVFHAAAEKHNQSIKSPDDVILTNILGSLHVFNAAAKAKVKKIIFSSSLYAHGSMSKPNQNEKDIPSPRTIYGTSKLAGEHMLEYFAKNKNLNFISLRYMFVYGPNQWSGNGYKSVIVKNFNRILNNESPVINGDGKQTMDFIYVSDVVRANLLAAKSSICNEIINIGSGKGISIVQLSRIMQKISKFHGEPVFAEPDITKGSYRVANINKAKKLLGFRSEISIESGLRETYKWIKDNKEII